MRILSFGRSFAIYSLAPFVSSITHRNSFSSSIPTTLTMPLYHIDTDIIHPHSSRVTVYRVLLNISQAYRRQTWKAGLKVHDVLSDEHQVGLLHFRHREYLLMSADRALRAPSKHCLCSHGARSKRYDARLPPKFEAAKDLAVYAQHPHPSRVQY